MSHSPFFVNGTDTVARTLSGGKPGLPTISQDLNSVRAYSWEIEFELPPIDTLGSESGVSRTLTLAAKQVSQTGMVINDIEVNRLNDRVYYPGKAAPEALTVTFDNLYNQKPAVLLWNWFKSIYNPMTGEMTPGINNFKAIRAVLTHMTPGGNPDQETVLFGVYPKSWKTAEFNYSTDDFHTIEVEFRYDFIDHSSLKGASVPSAVQFLADLAGNLAV